MRGHPDLKSERASSGKPAPKSQVLAVRNEDFDTALLAFQAAKLRRLYLFAHETARIIATLAYGVCR